MIGDAASLQLGTRHLLRLVLLFTAQFATASELEFGLQKLADPWNLEAEHRLWWQVSYVRSDFEILEQQRTYLQAKRDKSRNPSVKAKLLLEIQRIDQTLIENRAKLTDFLKNNLQVSQALDPGSKKFRLPVADLFDLPLLSLLNYTHHLKWQGKSTPGVVELAPFDSPLDLMYVSTVNSAILQFVSDWEKGAIQSNGFRNAIYLLMKAQPRAGLLTVKASPSARDARSKGFEALLRNPAVRTQLEPLLFAFTGLLTEDLIDYSYPQFWQLLEEMNPRTSLVEDLFTSFKTAANAQLQKFAHQSGGSQKDLDLLRTQILKIEERLSSLNADMVQFKITSSRFHHSQRGKNSGQTHILALNQMHRQHLQKALTIFKGKAIGLDKSDCEELL